MTVAHHERRPALGRSLAVEDDPRRSWVVGEQLVAVISGSAALGATAAALDLEPAQILDWCDRVRDALGVTDDTAPRWRPTGQVTVTHVATCELLEPGQNVMFTVTVENRTAATLRGTQLVARSLTNARMTPLTYSREHQRVDSDHLLEPGQRLTYTATYPLHEDDLTAGGELIAAIAIRSRTLGGAYVYIEEDADLDLSGAL